MAPQSIPDGYALIAGRGRDNARAALKAAVDAGFEESVVRTATGGYLVPVKVLDFLPDGPEAETPEGTESTEGTEGTENTEEGGDGASTEADSTAAATSVESTSADATVSDDSSSEPETTTPEAKTIEQPPKSGAGSGEEAWVKWAVEAKGYNADEGLSRNEIIAKYAD